MFSGSEVHGLYIFLCFIYTGDVNRLAWTGQWLNLKSLGQFPLMERKTTALNRVVDRLITGMEGFEGHLEANIGEKYLQFTSHAT